MARIATKKAHKPRPKQEQNPEENKY